MGSTRAPPTVPLPVASPAPGHCRVTSNSFTCEPECGNRERNGESDRPATSCSRQTCAPIEHQTCRQASRHVNVRTDMCCLTGRPGNNQIEDKILVLFIKIKALDFDPARVAAEPSTSYRGLKVADNIFYLILNVRFIICRVSCSIYLDTDVHTGQHKGVLTAWNFFRKKKRTLRGNAPSYLGNPMTSRWWQDKTKRLLAIMD